MLYYLFPKCEGDIVAKIRLAQEELYKIAAEEHRLSKAKRREEAATATE